MDTSKRVSHNYFYVVPAIAVLAADQTLKRWELKHLRLLFRAPIAGLEWFTLSRFHNNGVAGSRLSMLEQDQLNVWTKYLPTVLCAFLVLHFAIRFRHALFSEKTFSLMLLAAGFSNLWDNWRQDFVVDTFALYVGFGTFIPVNIADIVISFCLIALSVFYIREFASLQTN